jgi:hypothetical protein
MIDSWAARHGVTDAAMRELREILGAASEPEYKYVSARTEHGVSQRERLAASQAGARLWRNNSGAFRDDCGRWIRFGLCNDSRALNEGLKSADLIGIMPVKITPQMVGATIGQFMAREVKAPGWRWTGTDREVAQLNFLTLVATLGGDARFVS